MDIQDLILKIIKVINETGCGLTRDQLRDILSEDYDDVDWVAVFNCAINAGLLKIKNQKAQTLTYTPEGKKFLRKPHAIKLGDEDGGEPDSQTTTGTQFHSERSRLQIQLIQAVDHKQALDDFALDHDISLEDVIQNLNTLSRHGKRMDITYFVEEVISPDDIEDFRNSLSGHPFNMAKVRRDWGDVYSEEELSLLQYILS